MALSVRRSPAQVACAIALLAAVAMAGCADEPELVLQIRLPPDDQGLFQAVTQLNLTASRDEVVLAQESFPANTSTVSLTGVSHGPRTIIELEGVDSSNQVIAFGRTCPLDFDGPNTVAPLYFAPTSFFAPTAGTPAARYHPAGAALSDGTVVIVGGQDGEGNALASVELFVPGAATFSPISNHTVARKRAEAALLPDVGLLIVGGLVDGDDGPAAAAEVFLEAQRQFVTIADPRLVGLTGHQVVTLPDGRALVTGGVSGTTDAGYRALCRRDGRWHVQGQPGTHARGTTQRPRRHGGGRHADRVRRVRCQPRPPRHHRGDRRGLRDQRDHRAHADATGRGDGHRCCPTGRSCSSAGSGPTARRWPTPSCSTRSRVRPSRSTSSIHGTATRRRSSPTVASWSRAETGTARRSTEVELFVPGFDFVSERRLGTARANHLAVPLCDETVLLMGGGPGAELYTSAPR